MRIQKAEPLPTRAVPDRSGWWHGVLLVVMLAAIAVAARMLPLKEYFLFVLEWVKTLGYWGPFAVILAYIVACVLFLPGSVLTIGSGFLFKLIIGTVTVSIGSTLGACAAFLVGRTVARRWVARRIVGNAGFHAIDEAVGREGFKIVLLTRLSPIFPFNLLNYAFGLTKVRFSHYALASWIGMLPGTVLYVYLGHAARSLAEAAAGGVEKPFAHKIFFWVGLAVAMAVAFVVARIARRALGQADRHTVRAESPSHDTPEVRNLEPIHVKPEDRYNEVLVRNVHPPNWKNPEPLTRYNLVVVGAGTAGLVAAAGAVGLGAKVALVERHLMGGDCLNVGCVPSKCILRSSRAFAEVRDMDRCGVRWISGVQTAFPIVMERMRRLRSEISHHDSAARFRDLGVDVFLGHARFTGPDTVEVDGRALRFKKACIATGARAAVPNVEGLDEAGFLTNETVFSLTACPGRLAVFGAGPLGCEIAQAFSRLGSEVTIIEKQSQLLAREDPDAARILAQAFRKDRIAVLLNTSVIRVAGSPEGKVVHVLVDGKEKTLTVDEIFVGAGRTPNVEDLDLESAGVQYDKAAGVLVNDRLQTTNSRVYAAGDVCTKYKFTHTADAAARIVIQNALFWGRKKLSALTVPWCTYTDPEIAHVGMYERDAIEQGIEVDTLVQKLCDVDRAVVDGETEGLVKVHVKKKTDRIVGATIVAPHAGEMISELTLAMVSRMGLRTIANVIHPYPTQAEAIKKVADAYNRSRLTPFWKDVIERLMSWQR